MIRIQDFKTERGEWKKEIDVVNGDFFSFLLKPAQCKEMDYDNGRKRFGWELDCCQGQNLTATVKLSTTDINHRLLDGCEAGTMVLFRNAKFKDGIINVKDGKRTLVYDPTVLDMHYQLKQMTIDMRPTRSSTIYNCFERESNVNVTHAQEHGLQKGYILEVMYEVRRLKYLTGNTQLVLPVDPVEYISDNILRVARATLPQNYQRIGRAGKPTMTSRGDDKRLFAQEFNFKVKHFSLGKSL